MLRIYSSISPDYFLLCTKPAGGRMSHTFCRMWINKWPPLLSTFEWNQNQKPVGPLNISALIIPPKCCLVHSHGHPTVSTFKWDSPSLAHACTRRQAPTDLLCSKAFLMHVLNESQRIDGLSTITFPWDRLSCNEVSRMEKEKKKKWAEQKCRMSGEKLEWVPR